MKVSRPNIRSAVSCWLLATAAMFSQFAYGATVNMLSCCPGEDTATEARFVWHSDSDSCTFWYAKAAAPGDAVQATCESVHKPVSFRSSDVNYYKYTAELSGLEPGTEYIYYVKSGSTQFATQKFKTAGTSGSYNFLWLSDVHSHPNDSAKTNSVNTIMANAKSAAGSLDFILFSGDMVKYGARYDNWQQWNGNASLTEYMHALCPGNKEYYNTGSTTAGVNGSSSRIHNKWFLACRNNPQNGADGIESSYWFIRDGVMFVAMDTLADEGVDMDTYVYNNAFALQTNWFDRVVSEQEGKKSFRYLVVFQHYPHFTYAEGDGFKYGSGRYKKWKDLFDKHKVDFALTGDHHNYSRSKKLRGGSENSEGTVYITAPEIGTSLYSPSVKAADKLNSYGVTSGDNPTVRTLMATAHNGDEAVGGVWFSVTPQKMTMHYIGTSTSPYDTVEVTPKDRGFEYEYTPPVVVEGFDGKPHSRYRFAVDAPRSDTWSMQLSEVELLDAHGKVIHPNAFTLAYDSTTKDSYGDIFGSGETPECAVDGSTSTKWLDWRAGLAQSAAVRSAVWLDFSFAQPTAVYGYQWYTANDAPERTPVSWTFSASDDDGATWTVLDKVVGYDTTTETNAPAYTKNIAFLPASDKWLEETAEMSKATGTWSEAVVYGEDGRAFFDSDAGEITFTPYTASTGNVVTVETKAQFCEYTRDDVPDMTAQAAVRLSTNGCFQVWAKKQLGVESGGVGELGWIDVEAEGVTPVSGEEYTLRTTFDYTAGTYSVEVKTGLTEFTRLVGVQSSSSRKEDSNSALQLQLETPTFSFPLAVVTNCVSSIGFVGDTYFTSLDGDCRYEIIGFVADEALALSNNVQIVLSAAKAAWLNKCGGDKATVAGAAAGLSEKDFTDAYLLNLDITDGDRSYTFEITDIDVGDTSVSVAVTLTRSGSIAQPVNGILKFYGAATLAAFKDGATELGAAELTNETFSGGETATATILLDGETPPAFFNAKIEEQ